MELILESLYLMLPGILANMMPVLIGNKLKFLAYPVDGNKKWKDGESILGSHKTWRGLFVGILGAIVVVAAQKYLVRWDYFESISLIPYGQYSYWLVGFLIGFGVLFGDMAKSFFKRRFKIQPGKRFIPWDQIDSVVGALFFLSFVWVPSWRVAAVLMIISFFIHIAIRHIGFYVGLNKEKW